MKKIISLFIAAVMVFALAAGTGILADALAGDCNGDGVLDNKDVVLLFRYVSVNKDGAYDEKYDFIGDESVDNKDVVDLFREVSGSDELPEFLDGIIGGNTTGDPSGDPSYSVDDKYEEGYEYSEMPSEWETYPGYEGEVAVEPGYEEEPPYIIGPGYPDAVAGTLSAGEWKDADNIEAWRTLLAKDGWAELVAARNLNAANVITVKVVDGENACFNVPVKLLAGEEVLYTAKTDINGNAYLFHSVAREEDPDSILVGDEVISLDGRTEIQVEAAGAGIEVTALDLMLMIDTTGSMGDELEYIKAELSDMVQRVAAQDQSLSIRISVNFYRDEGDVYIVKYYDFRSDVNECVQQLSAEHAYGGGDYPEAVHTALDNAVEGHRWREGAVKLCFLVLDAPPHKEYEIQGIDAMLQNTVRSAADKGIRIIPVASSGVDTETEFLLRSWAVMTGGTYVFITDDSGIGYGHQDPEVGEHTVEYLNECMIRIACQYCGIYTGEVIPYTPTYHQ